MHGSRMWSVAALAMALAACGQTPDQDYTRAMPRLEVSQSEHERWRGYLDAVQEAEALGDRVKTCLAYPDLPGQQWPDDAAKARCLILRESELSLEKIGDMLDAPDGAQRLDAWYAESLRAHYLGDDRADQLFIDFEIWDDSEAAGELSERWLRASPESAYALTARGLVRLSEALRERGGKFIDETSQQQLRGMTRGFQRALPLLRRALALEPRLSPACDAQFKIGQYIGDVVVRAQAHEACRSVDPGSWYVVHTWLLQAAPKWHGTQADLEAVLRHIQTHQARYPVLVSLAGDMEQAQALIALNQKAPVMPYSALLIKATAQRPLPDMLGYAAADAYRRQHYLGAAGYASQALRFIPDRRYFRVLRTGAYDRLGRFVDAVRDGQRLVATGDADAFTYNSLGRSAQELGQYDLARESLEKALEGSPDPHWTYRNWCQLQITPQLFADKALTCTEELVDRYPKDPRSLFMRAWVLMDVGDPGAEAMAERFFAAADPKDRAQASFAQQLRQRMGRPPQ